MSKAIEQSVKQKLKNIEKDQGIEFNRLLDTLFLERILVRIGKSKYKNQLVFKGGMCLSQFLKLGRGTKDIDFLLRELTSNEDNLKQIFEEIVAIDCKDGFVFNSIQIGQLSLENKKYPGYRISIVGTLGQIKNKSTIDIGVGDVVRPRVVDVELMKGTKALFEDSIELSAYPPEYIFSEKYEAIIYFDEINGRMKDYYDCHKLITESVLDEEELKVAIKDTFETRGTELGFIPENVIDALESRWKSFLGKEKIKDIKLNELVADINEFLKSLQINGLG